MLHHHLPPSDFLPENVLSSQVHSCQPCAEHMEREKAPGRGEERLIIIFSIQQQHRVFFLSFSFAMDFMQCKQHPAMPWSHQYYKSAFLVLSSPHECKQELPGVLAMSVC